MYTPLLKARDAEIEVLSAVDHKDDIVPIFELQKAPEYYIEKRTQKERNKRSAATHASYFIDRIARRWDRPMFVDVDRVAGLDTEHLWLRLLSLLAELCPTKPPMSPVVGLGYSRDALAEAAVLAQITGAAALRVDLPHPDIASLSDKLSSIAASLEIAPNGIAIILDWKDRLDRHSLDDAVEHTRAAASAFGTSHGNIITLGAPDDSGCQQAGDWKLLRREWWLWLRMQDHADNVVYGDYALYPPADPGFGRSVYAHLRYSHHDALWVHRRRAPEKGNIYGVEANLSGAFRLCCRHLVDSTHFYGPTFSDSDRKIHDIATNDAMKSPGKAQDWREITVKHHFAAVAKQLAAPPPPPPAGTE